CFFFFSSRRRHTRSDRDWSSDVCSSDLKQLAILQAEGVDLRRVVIVHRRNCVAVANDYSAQVDAFGLQDRELLYPVWPSGGVGEIGRASCRERGWSWVVTVGVEGERVRL